MDRLDPELGRLIAAFFGSLIYSFLRPNPRWQAWTANVTIGTAVGVFGAPILCEWQGWTQNVHASNGVAAGLGLTGVIVARSVLVLAESNAVQAWVRKWLGIQENGWPKPPRTEPGSDPKPT